MASGTESVKMNHSNVSVMLPSIGIYILAAFVATTAVATLIHHELLEESNLHYYAMAILFVASATGTLVNRNRKWLTSLLNGMVFMALTLLMTSLCFGAQFQGIKGGAIAILLGCLFSSMLGRKQGRRRKKHRSKK